jgi:hypothetical protein
MISNESLNNLFADASGSHTVRAFDNVGIKRVKQAS